MRIIVLGFIGGTSLVLRKHPHEAPPPAEAGMSGDNPRIGSSRHRIFRPDGAENFKLIGYNKPAWLTDSRALLPGFTCRPRPRISLPEVCSAALFRCRLQPVDEENQITDEAEAKGDAV